MKGDTNSNLQTGQNWGSPGVGYGGVISNTPRTTDYGNNNPWQMPQMPKFNAGMTGQEQMQPAPMQSDSNNSPWGAGFIPNMGSFLDPNRYNQRNPFQDFINNETRATPQQLGISPGYQQGSISPMPNRGIGIMRLPTGQEIYT